MFGHDWDKAEATIVARDAKYSGDGSVATYTYVADVRRSAGTTFRATINEPTIATDFWPPGIGDTVSVLVKPKDDKVKFDKDDPRLSVKNYHAVKDKAFEAAQHQPVGTPPPTWSAPADLPDALASRLAQLGIVPGGAMPVIMGNSAEGQAALAALTHLGGVAAAPTPQARLETLLALHGRGLMTSDEYAEQRQRILDEV